MARSEPDFRERNIARAVIDTTLRVRRGESVTIEAWTHSLPWARACFYEAIDQGAHPIILYHDDATYWSLVEGGRAREVGLLGDHEYAALSKSDAYVYFEGPEDRARYHALSEKDRSLAGAWESKWWRVARKSGLRLAWMLVGRAVPASARFFGVDLDDWREELYRASLVDPRRMKREGSRIAHRLARGRTLHVTHPNGTDLELRLRRRVPTVHDGLLDAADAAAGHIMEELPSGFVPVAVDERYAEGDIYSNVPARTPDGRDRLAGSHWVFRAGRLVEFTDEEGHDEVARAFAQAPPTGRDRPGVFSIGLNPEISLSPFVNDQRRGRMLLMVGGNHHYGGSNACDFRTYILLDGATAEVDGRAILRGGRPV